MRNSVNNPCDKIHVSKHMRCSFCAGLREDSARMPNSRWDSLGLDIRYYIHVFIEPIGKFLHRITTKKSSKQFQILNEFGTELDSFLMPQF